MKTIEGINTVVKFSRFSYRKYINNESEIAYILNMKP